MSKVTITTDEEHQKWLRKNGNRYMARLRASQGLVEVWALNREDAEGVVEIKYPGIKVESIVLVPKENDGMSSFEPAT